MVNSIMLQSLRMGNVYGVFCWICHFEQSKTVHASHSPLPNDVVCEWLFTQEFVTSILKFKCKIQKMFIWIALVFICVCIMNNHLFVAHYFHLNEITPRQIYTCSLTLMAFHAPPPPPVHPDTIHTPFILPDKSHPVSIWWSSTVWRHPSSTYELPYPIRL